MPVGGFGAQRRGTRGKAAARFDNARVAAADSATAASGNAENADTDDEAADADGAIAADGGGASEDIASGDGGGGGGGSADTVAHFFTCNDHDTVLFFTNRGVAYGVRAFDIPEVTSNWDGGSQCTSSASPR